MRLEEAHSYWLCRMAPVVDSIHNILRSTHVAEVQIQAEDLSKIDKAPNLLPLYPLRNATRALLEAIKALEDKVQESQRPSVSNIQSSF